MNYIYDLMLNFCDCFRCFDFYEWMKKDDIINVDKIPIIRINKFQMSDIINNKIKVSEKLLNSVENKTLLENGKVLKYVVLVTDLSKVLALEFNDSGEVIRSSSLLLDEEDSVIEECLEFSEEKLEYEIMVRYSEYDFLTREERIIKNNLLLELKSLYSNKNYDEIRYLYEELYDDDKSIHEKYKFLMNDIKNNFSSKYHKLYDIIRLT